MDEVTITEALNRVAAMTLRIRGRKRELGQSESDLKRVTDFAQLIFALADVARSGIEGGWAGEHGPELMGLRGGERVIPKPQEPDSE